ncbi:acyl-CoA thioesterase [Janibacter sp. GS2]|uniref:acyl-CoA thioesterase n=1 Tax=Janibacter sp. GS2 TaxID=3442646 RepID=UPI003EBCA008
MSSPTESAQRFSTEIVLRWGDMDAYGHVNNVQYHRLLEEARVRAFASWFNSTGPDSMLSSGVLLARQEIEYLDQLAYRQEPVLVEMWITQIGGASWDMAYEMRDGPGADRALYARAESTLVAFDIADQRPRRLTDDERASLTVFLGEPAAMRRRR